MVTLLLDSTQLEVVLSPFERTLARRVDPVRVERASIRKVQLTDDAWTWLRGVPNPGTRVRGTIAMGTWRSSGGDDFVVVRRRQPAAVIDLLPGAEFARLVLTTRHGIALVQALRLEGEDDPLDVAEIAAAAEREESVSPRPRRRRRAAPSAVTA